MRSIQEKNEELAEIKSIFVEIIDKAALINKIVDKLQLLSFNDPSKRRGRGSMARVSRWLPPR